MDKKFIELLQMLTEKHGRDILLDEKMCRRILSDYARGEFSNEIRLLSAALDAGIPYEINSTKNINSSKSELVDALKEISSIQYDRAVSIIEILASILRDDSPLPEQQDISDILPKAIDLFRKKDYQNAYNLFKIAHDIEPHNAEIQFFIGKCRVFCVGDYRDAFQWYTKAAEQNHKDAQFSIGLCYDFGDGVTKDKYLAVEWYKKAADQNHPTAQYNLGSSYENGEGVEKDFSKAIEWYKKSAINGEPLAQNRLGNLFASGSGVPYITFDPIKAVEWFTKAAMQGLALAQRNLGRCYAQGFGTNLDNYKAQEWYKKAADQGDEFARSQLNG